MRSGVLGVMQPFTCGKVCLGQAGQCLNIGLREHNACLDTLPSGRLAIHYNRFEGHLFFRTLLLRRKKKKMKRPTKLLRFLKLRKPGVPASVHHLWHCARRRF